ncbi:DNA topoisomerase VI subunit B [Bdellovibrio bacteriovorus]|uniref:DNA topoisomerase VI subunit B n=1 Tax=Bdellovibrio bacteriovorus TaxID=959 RepID=UPI0021D1E49E|nr:DNA topoisomerase VI subunit B [Bdellovibrio bacteriovorus]UXR66029.1 DNA topoisomerase VI subunit B [Bdellovibrio bacteriovorus]
MSKITKSSTAEYFAKNLQQVGFSSPLKAVLTTLKEAVDNSLDACESAGILPDLLVEISKVGAGSTKNTDLIRIVVEDNGPGIEGEDLAKVYGEYLASSKFGRGQCSRGQQGIGISAATTWAQMTNARGVSVISKTKKMRKAISAQVDVDIKSNTGVLKNKETLDWDREHGTRVEFVLDGRIQLNGDGGLLTYIEGTILVNPHMTITYKLTDGDFITVTRVSTDVPRVPEASLPHPHTFKLGEFITHSTLFGKTTLSKFLKTGFSRISDQSISDFVKKGLPKGLLEKPLTALSEEDFKKVFQAVQNTDLMAPSTKSVLTVGEEALSKSITRLGEIDFFAVVTRKPTICDFKPVVVEVALARFKDRNQQNDSPVTLLRFANRVPLQFDKSGCAITWAIESVNWKAYGLGQPKDSLPLGPYIFAVSIVSPFIKFKNASKETIDASEELVAEIRLALIQAGQKLSRHIKKEVKEADLERKLAHIEQFGPILVEGLARIIKAPEARKKKAEEGLKKLLGRDSEAAIADLEAAESKLLEQKKREKKKGIDHGDEDEVDVISSEDLVEEASAPQGTKKTTTKKTVTTKKTTGKKS